MTEDEIVERLLKRYKGLVPTDAWGETSFFYNPREVLKRGVYFATVKSKEGDNDKASRLDRDGIFRLNIGTPLKTYETLFGPRAERPAKGGVVRNPVGKDWDFAQLDTILPHPVYAWMGWSCVLNPTLTTWTTCIPLLDDAYAKSKAAFRRRHK